LNSNNNFPKKAVIFDLDGTIYIGNKIVEGVSEVLRNLKDINYEILFITNNSGKTREEIREKLANMNIETDINRIYTSAYATGMYLYENKINEIFVIGTKSFKKELEKFSLKFVKPENAEAVVVGLDTNFSYTDIAEGLRALESGAKLVASNVDKNFPVGKNIIMPGCNAIVASLLGSCSQNIEPFVVGKPNTYILEIICHDWNLDKEKIWLIGDSIESDITMANRFGCKSILVGKYGIHIKDILRRIKDEYFGIPND